MMEFKSGVGYKRRESDPFAGYEAVYSDNPGTTDYYAYERADGAWIIQRDVISNDLTTTRYAVGTSGVVAAWAARAGTTYRLPSEVFNV